MSYNYPTGGSYFPFNGLVDDIKVFATTLSDKKIKKLYQVKSKIDKNGNVYCNEFIEKGNSFFMDESNQVSSSNAQIIKNGGDNIEIKIKNAVGWVSESYNIKQYLQDGKKYKIWIKANEKCNKNLNDGVGGDNRYGRTYGYIELQCTKISDGKVDKFGKAINDTNPCNLGFTVDYSKYKEYYIYIFPNCTDTTNCLKGNYIYENFYLEEIDSDYNTNISKKSVLMTGRIIEENNKIEIKKYNILEVNEIIEN